MMQMFKNSKNLIMGAVLIILLIVAYFTFFKKNKEDDALTTTQVTSNQSVIGKELIEEFNRLRALKNINDGFFNDPAFLSLKDITIPVSPEPIGRSNPFAPVGI
jgi:hypothetical protein